MTDDLISRQAAIEAACDGADEWDGGRNERKGEPMPRYIDADKAINELADMHCKSDEDGYVWIIRSDAWARIDAIPTADVRENVRGEWIHKYTHESLHDRTGIWCSACGRDALQDSEGYYIEDCETDFCPHCGADMRGEKDGKI